MTRGEIWITAGGPGYAGKPRPAVIVQDDAFQETASVTICPLTTLVRDAPLTRLSVEPSVTNGLRKPSQLMIDKLGAVPRGRCTVRIGQLSDDDMRRMSASVMVFLGLARSRGRQ